MLLLDSLLVGGLRFLLDKIARAAEAESQDDSAPRERLLEARARLERGEITEDELVAAEREFVAALGRIRGAVQQPISMPPGRGAQIETFDSDSLDPD
jgi:Gas vesicle protein G